MAVVRRLWGWFEVLPFRRGMTLLAGLAAVPVLAIGGAFLFGGHGGSAGGPVVGLSPTPPKGHTAAERQERMTGEYVMSPPVRPAPSPAGPAPTRHAAASPNPRARASVTAPPTSCPSDLKRWPWMWDMCRHHAPDHTHR